MHIEPHGIRTMSKHQFRAEFGCLGHLAGFFFQFSRILKFSLIFMNIQIRKFAYLTM